MKLVYFHGFGSSHASGTVETLRRELPNDEVVAPDIPVDPVEALPYLKELCEKEQPDLILGTSMGGMYAQQMRGFTRILVNPAFTMSTNSMAGMMERRRSRLRRTSFSISIRWNVSNLRISHQKKRRIAGVWLDCMTPPSPMLNHSSRRTT